MNFIQKEDVDFNRWFRRDDLSSFEHQGKRRYIAPLDLSGSEFDWEEYLHKHFHQLYNQYQCQRFNSRAQKGSQFERLIKNWLYG